MQVIPSVVLVAGAIGATIGLLLGLVVAVPLLLVPARAVTLPLAVLVLVVLAYAGARTGAARVGDFGRWVGARGRLSVTNPSRGGGTKLVDTSALMDTRLVDVARRGFLDGTLVVPMFVLEELQSLADGGDRRRAGLARRGLDALQTLQHEALVAVEVTDDEVPGVREVDAKLAALCRERSCSLVTVDGNLERVAEIAGIRVLNLHGLADALRPPVQPGDEVSIELVKEGQQAGQAVGYLDDGTMVVVEDASGQVGASVDASHHVSHPDEAGPHALRGTRHGRRRRGCRSGRGWPARGTGSGVTMRVGLGVDVHPFAGEPRPLVLGGHVVDAERGLDGHSDADVVCHALVDALLGAVARR